MNNKQWTQEERLAAINKAAQVGFYNFDIEYYVLIGALTNATPELLNNDSDIIEYLKEIENPTFKVKETE